MSCCICKVLSDKTRWKTYTMDSTQPDMTSDATNTTVLACGFESFSGSLWQKVTVIATTVFILAGNAINLVILGTTKSLRNAHGYLLSALATGGLAVGCSATLAIYPVLTTCWPYGDIICQVCAYLFELCMTFNLLIVVLLSGERYIAIAHPFRYKLLITKTNTKIAIGASLLVSSVLLTVLAVTQPEFEYRPRRYICRLTKNDEILGLSSTVISAILVVFSFFVFSFTSLTLLRVVARQSSERNRLFGSRVGLPANPRACTHNSRLFKATVLIATTFYISWIPAIVSGVLNVVDSDVMDNSPVFEFVAQWLLISNTVFNTLIYFFMIKLFRDRAREISAQLCCCLCVFLKRVRGSDPRSDSGNRLDIDLAVLSTGNANT